MEKEQFNKIQGWFEVLNTQIRKEVGAVKEEIGGLKERTLETDKKIIFIKEEITSVKKEMVTKQQFENQIQVILTAISALYKRMDDYILYNFC